jgi:hypothetical protein
LFLEITFTKSRGGAHARRPSDNADGMRRRMPLQERSVDYGGAAVAYLQMAVTVALGAKAERRGGYASASSRVLLL